MDGVTLQSHFSLWASLSLVNDGTWTRTYLWPLLTLKVCVVSMEGLELGTLQNWWVWILACRLESTWVTRQLSDLAMRPYKVQGPWQMGECISLGGLGKVRKGVVSLIWLTAGLWECWISRQIWFPQKSQMSTFYKSGIFHFWSVAINSKLEKCIVKAKPNIFRPELTQRSLIVPPHLKQWAANVALGTQDRLGISFSEHWRYSQTSLWFLPELQAMQHTKSVDFEGGSPGAPLAALTMFSLLCQEKPEMWAATWRFCFFFGTIQFPPNIPNWVK